MQPLYPMSFITSVIELLLVINTKSNRVLCLMGELPYTWKMRGILVSRPDHMNPIVAGVHSCYKWKWFGSPRALLRLGQNIRQQQQQWLVGLQDQSEPPSPPQKLTELELGCMALQERDLLDGAQVWKREEASVDCFKEEGGERRTIRLTRFISGG